jgi:poly(3-hydroxybutyrate) depolymerase
MAGFEQQTRWGSYDNNLQPHTSGDAVSFLSIMSEKSVAGAPTNDKHTTSALAPGATTEQSIKVGDDTRQVAVHVPKNWDGKSPLPVLYYFNGMRPDGKPEPESFTGLSERADKMGFAIAYMRGSNEGTQTYNNGQGIFANSKDENAYLNAVHQSLEKQLPLDENRQGLAGFSEGGSEAYALAASNKWVSSVQTVEGYMTGYEPPINHPMSEQNIHALHDPIIPENGTEQVASQAAREARDAAFLLGLNPILDMKAAFHALTAGIENHGNYIEAQRYTVNAYKAAAGMTGINGIGQTTITPDMSIYDFNNPANGAEVRQVTLAQGTHAWAGSTDHSGDIPIIGQPNEKYSASDSISQFFLEHPLIQNTAQH